MAIKRSIIPEVGLEDSYEIVHRHLPVDQPPSSFTYIVSKVDGGYVIKNGKTGVIEYVEWDQSRAERAINWAINNLPSDGGRILLSEGLFVVSDNILIAGTAGSPKLNIILEGQGAGTILKLADGAAVAIIRLRYAKRIFIKSLNLNGNKENQPANILVAEGIDFEYQVFDSLVEDLFIFNCASDGINIDTSNHIIVQNCYIEGCRRKAVHVAVGDPQHIIVKEVYSTKNGWDDKLAAFDIYNDAGVAGDHCSFINCQSVEDWKAFEISGGDNKVLNCRIISPVRREVIDLDSISRNCEIRGNLLEDINQETWTSPTGYNDPGDEWTGEPNAYDDDTGTRASRLYLPPLTWSDFLELTHDGFVADKVRHYSILSAAASLIDIDVYYDDSWHDVYQGGFPNLSWDEKDIPGGAQYITKARVRFYNGHTTSTLSHHLYEFDFYRTKLKIADAGTQNIKEDNIGYPNKTSGVSTFSGDGTATEFTIASHNLAENPTDQKRLFCEVTPVSADAQGASPCECYPYDADGDGAYEALRVKFSTAPPSGTDNVVVRFKAELY